MTVGAAGCCMRVLRRVFTRPEDTEAEARRTVMFAASTIMICVVVVATWIPVGPYRYGWLLLPIFSLCLAVWLSVLARLAWTRRLTMHLIGANTLACAAAVAMLDVSTMGEYTRWWPMFVAIIDTLLVLEAPRWMSSVLVGYVVVHLFVTQLENAYRFGLLDVEGITYDRRPYLAPVVECERPPCADTEGFNVSVFTLAAFVFCIDFYFTRGFAAALHKEKQAMEESIALAERIAECLARFDLAAAKEELAVVGVTRLPEDLGASYRALLQNLASYRPFLPQSVLPEGRPSDDEESEAAVETEGSTRAESINSESSARSSASAPSASLPKFARVPSDPVPVPSPSDVCFSGHRNMLLLTGLKSARCTLVQVWAKLEAVLEEELLADFTALHESYVSMVVAAANACRGVVDAFVGGAVTVSFNASRPCAQHPHSAGMAAKTMTPQLEETLGERATWCGAIASGAAYVGALGTATLRRPSVLGPAAEALGEVVRVAERAGGGVWLSNTMFYADQRAACELRIWLHRVRFAKTAGEKETDAVMYELLARGGGEAEGDAAAGNLASESSGDGEWMYTIKNAGAGWEHYNAAGRALLNGSLADARRYLEQQKVVSETVAAFEAAAAAAEEVCFFPRAVPLRASGRPVENHELNRLLSVS